MKRCLALLLAAGAVHLGAYGVSPSRGDQAGQAQPGRFNQQPFQLPPAPQPSNNLMNPGPPQPGAFPQAGGAPEPTRAPNKPNDETSKTSHPAHWRTPSG